MSWRSREKPEPNAIMLFLRCSHFLCKLHIPHTTNFDNLINCVISCGGNYLEEFVQQRMHPIPHQMLLPISWRQQVYGLMS